MSHREEKLLYDFFYWEMYRKDHYIDCLWHLCDSVIEAEANMGNFSTFCLNLSDSWKPSYQNGSPINRFNPATCCCVCFKPDPRFTAGPDNCLLCILGAWQGDSKEWILLLLHVVIIPVLTFIFICINCLYHYTILFSSIDGIAKQFIYSFISWIYIIFSR